MNTPTPADGVTVEQVDRDAAASYYKGRLSSKLVAGIASGDYDDLELVQAFARHRQRATRPAPGVGEVERVALDRIVKFVADYFAPWGAWKTAWWEGEVSDEAAFSDNNALKHVSNIASKAIAALRAIPKAPRREEMREAVAALIAARYTVGDLRQARAALASCRGKGE